MKKIFRVAGFMGIPISVSIWFLFCVLATVATLAGMGKADEIAHDVRRAWRWVLDCGMD